MYVKKIVDIVVVDLVVVDIVIVDNVIVIDVVVVDIVVVVVVKNFNEFFSVLIIREKRLINRTAP